jgi:type IV pilus assembly protein PilC
MAKMIEFAYTARNNRGREVSGQLLAETKNEVLDSLKERQLSPIEIVETEGKSAFTRALHLPKWQRKVSLKDLAVMTRQLSTMVSSGLPLAKAFSILASQTENAKLGQILSEVRADVQSGITLSVALERRPETFPVLMTSLISAGEAGGFLDKALDSVAQTFESDSKLRSTIRSAMTYPIAVLIMAILGVIGMLIFIVPIFQKMFSDLGGTLPWPTQVLVFLSPIAAWGSPFLLLAVLVFMSWWRRNKNQEWVRKLVDPLKLRIPVFGNLFKKIALARFARNFSSMIRAGVPIMQALGVIGQTAGNWQVEQAVARVQESVRLGTTVSQPMAAEKVFPVMVTQMVSVGEDAGSLETMLSKIADFYDQEIEATTTQLTALIEPLMIAFIGVIIGAMLISLYLPIFTIFTVIH